MVRIVCNAHALVMEAENAITTIYTGLHIRCPRTGIRVIYACAQTRSKFKFEKADVGTMPTPYSIDLRWRVVWFDLVHGFASHEIADLFCLSERTVRRYITLFHQTGDVKPVSCRNGPQRLLGDVEQLHLFQLILRNPGIYLHELQHRLQEAYGVRVPCFHNMPYP